MIRHGVTRSMRRFAAGFTAAVALMATTGEVFAHKRPHGGWEPPSRESLRLEFAPITHGNATNGAIGSGQLFVTVTDPAGRGNVMFSFFNLGPAPSSITDIYFDDGSEPTLRSIDRIYNSFGVRFVSGARPFDLPGGEDMASEFHTSRRLSAEAVRPSLRRGVNPGESFSMQLRLLSGVQYSDVLDDIRSGDLRVGLRVSGFENGGAESFVNSVDVTPAIPEPTTLAFFSLGALLLAVNRRKWRSKRKALETAPAH